MLRNMRFFDVVPSKYLRDCLRKFRYFHELCHSSGCNLLNLGYSEVVPLASRPLLF